MLNDERRFRRSRSLALEWADQQALFAVCTTGLRVPADLAVIALVTRLDDWTAQSGLAEDGVDVSLEALDTLATLGILDADEDGTSPTPPWHPFDLDVQRTQSRGADRRRAGSPPPAFPAGDDGAWVPLPVGPTPSLPLVEAISQRRSVRRYQDVALPLEALGTLLHHAARVRSSTTVPDLGEIVFYPYPSAGARSELGIYVVASNVMDLAPGAYRFEPRALGLVPVPTTQAAQTFLRGWIREAMGTGPGPMPGAVLIFTAVFDRLFWKYGRFGLTLAYQDLGCLDQTLYLVSTALGLGACAIGAGRSNETSSLLGLNEFGETPIGYMALGVPAHEQRSSPHHPVGE